MEKKKVIVVGGGAAGFFCAIQIAELHPDWEISILEKTNKILSKVKVSGGGRCNVTHASYENKTLAKHYPRGENYLKKAFEVFNSKSTIEWFGKRGVEMKTYPDGCIFPLSNDSQTIIDCFENEARKFGIHIHLNSAIIGISKIENSF